MPHTCSFQRFAHLAILFFLPEPQTSNGRTTPRGMKAPCHPAWHAGLSKPCTFNARGMRALCGLLRQRPCFSPRLVWCSDEQHSVIFIFEGYIRGHAIGTRMPKHSKAGYVNESLPPSRIDLFALMWFKIMSTRF